MAEDTTLNELFHKASNALHGVKDIAVRTNNTDLQIQLTPVDAFLRAYDLKHFPRDGVNGSQISFAKSNGLEQS